MANQKPLDIVGQNEPQYRFACGHTGQPPMCGRCRADKSRKKLAKFSRRGPKFDQFRLPDQSKFAATFQANTNLWRVSLSLTNGPTLYTQCPSIEAAVRELGQRALGVGSENNQ